MYALCLRAGRVAQQAHCLPFGTGTSYGCQLVSRLLHFPSSTYGLGRQGRMARVLRTLRLCGSLGRSSCYSFASVQLCRGAHLRSEPVDGTPLYLSFSLSLCEICLSNKNFKKSLKMLFYRFHIYSLKMNIL